jgi:MoaA/NifB/PqqE/SkfB family radical SAM enzyme
MPTEVATIDFHVTSECGQECPYCWGPQDFEHPVDTDTALRIISRVRQLGPKRIVFTGGDPLKRPDIARLIRHARESGLEVALSTSGDEVTEEFLAESATNIDLISLPLDGSSEAVNSRTKEKGHFDSIIRALGWLRGYPAVDVKVCTPVTRHNLADVPNIVRLVEEYAETTTARVFYNIFQTFPRAMFQVDWGSLLVTDEEFSDLASRLKSAERARKITLNVLNHSTLDRLYVMIFPDGSLIVPVGADFVNCGQFLEIHDLDKALENTEFDSPKHLKHSRAWERAKPASGNQP